MDYYVLFQFVVMTYVMKYLQIMIHFVLPNYLGSFGGNSAIGVLVIGFSVQYLSRFFRLLQIEQSTKGFELAPPSAKDIKNNLLIFMLACHLVGSCWYLFGLQRVNRCLRDVCYSSNITGCSTLVGCRIGQKSHLWSNNVNAMACLDSSSSVFQYGIYEDAVLLTTETSVVNKYVFTLFWGFRQVITLADNLNPSHFVWEVVFTMAIMGLGLYFFVLLVGNIQSFVQTLRHRRLEKNIKHKNLTFSSPL
ncbi:cyclic nucleotide-gated ion channel 20 [Spatholobus suberectus]|nr:cyclic nucleotide-gated ion channel 20 [Spatholobus suberectus]